ncbi:MAG TPA: Lrp/AsnC family transcriptional regulator [Chitinophagaceae bacterium]
MAINSKKDESAITGLDQKDVSILRLLQENARITVKEISERVHLSTTPVHERIKRLEETGVITRYAALVNPSSVNKGLMVIVYVSLRQHNKTAGTRFIRSINEMPEVMECYNIS